MKSRAFFALVTLLLARGFASCVQSATQDEKETLWAFIKTLESFDDGVLQEALRIKYERGKLGYPIAPGRESLRYLVGIEGVRLFVSPDLKESGLIEEAVKARVELKLRQNGITISEPPDDPNGFKIWMLSHPRGTFNMSSLHVYMESISLSKTNVMAAHVTVSQSQSVDLLSADKPMLMVVRTWEEGQYLIGFGQKVAEGCREAVNDLLDIYCNDWLATHPLPKPERPSDPNDQGSHGQNHGSGEACKRQDEIEEGCQNLHG